MFDDTEKQSERGRPVGLVGGPEFLTTGQAADLLGVTADTVLRWIKNGRLCATQTAGGHNRILREDVTELARDRPSSLAVTRERDRLSGPLHCWEYLSPKGEAREECKRCIVYRVRATCCFELAQVQEPGLEHTRLFCETSCEDCTYYRRVKRLATHVLVITRDGEFRNCLGGDQPDALKLRFVRNGYEASTAVGEFRPGFVVLDGDLGKKEVEDLLDCLEADRRVPGLRIVLALRHGATLDSGQEDRNFVIGSVGRPVDACCLEALIDGVLVDFAAPDSTGEMPSTEAYQAGP